MEQSVQSAEIDRFLAVVRAELDSYKRFMELHAPQLAPGFNAVSILYPNENRLSNVIAMLLDPKGAHGQGAIFLRLFLQIFTDSASYESAFVEKLGHLTRLSDVEKVAACTEAGLEVATNLIDNSQRRIDILLEFSLSPNKSFGLAIENKPWTYDQDSQIHDYHDYLWRRYRNGAFVLIYLSRDGALPSIESVGERDRLAMIEAGRLAIMSYSQLRAWCLECVKECKSHRVRFFLEDFATYLKHEFEGGKSMNEENIVVDSALKPANLKAAVAVGLSWPAIANRLIKELVTRVLEQIDAGGQHWKADVDFDYNTANTGFYISTEEWVHYRIRFAFSSAKAKGLEHGIVNKTGNIDDSPKQLVECLKNSLVGPCAQTGWWPWSQPLQTPYYDWSESEEPWTGICSGGETVKVFVDKLERLIACCQESSDKL